MCAKAKTMKLSQEKIDKIYKTAQLCIGIIFFGGLLVLCLLPKHWGSWPFWTWLGLFVVAIVVSAIFKRWATDEEVEEFKKAVREAVREAQQAEEKKPQPVSSSNDTPLINLTDEQKVRIEQFFHDLPSHHDNKEAMNMKEVARFIRALVDLGYISQATSVDLNGLRQWASQVTGKTAPKQSPFNEAIRKATPANIENAVQTIQKLLQ